MKKTLISLALLAIALPAMAMDTFDLRIRNEQPVSITRVHSRNLATCELSRDMNSNIIRPGDAQTITVGDGYGCEYRVQVEFADGTEDRVSFNLCRHTGWSLQRRPPQRQAYCVRNQ